ncbi:Non-reducing polyketide synthase vrtA [Penicillium malachiteum]|uniref:Non-reducing polyketide synthase vrtA n=1 Tax=Penicillium malachiteum TaxID=1324776 RepID=UPI002546BFA9|nr:Non-reducing polyketide synthase vrtA [Penicillium malachiteum]KAJ5714339.1 Non-reducing polyketide synthase vrtA [Penicillium malachiteum]
MDTIQESTSVKLLFFGNEFPNDDLKDLFRRFVQHGKDRRFRLLAAFLDESTLVLKQEISKLSQVLKDQIPHFDTVLTLVEHGDFRAGALGAAMESALLIVLQLGMLIGHHEAEDVELNLDPKHTTLAGLSIGLFAGAAVALSTSLAEVVKNGAESLRISFRIGVYVGEVSRKLEAPQPDGALQSWAHVVTGMSSKVIQDELSRFNAESGNPEISKVFVSAADKASVSVSGPPSRLKTAFQHSHDLRYSKSLPLPVYDGLCHAKHLYTQEDIHFVTNISESVIPRSRPVRLPLLSSRTGKPFAASTAQELFLEIGTELLTGTIYLDKVTAGILDHTGAMSSTTMQCQVDTFRTSLVMKGILQAIETTFPSLEVSRRDMVDWIYKEFGAQRPSSFAGAKLAIVGMACRLPGGANDPELFWELLEKCRDTHTVVPADRFDLETHHDPTGKIENATQTPYGNFIDRPGFFDASFFKMSPREAEQTDPMQRLALVTAYEAIEMAGIVPGRIASSRPSRFGTFYGQASDDWRELNASQNIGTYAVPGGERAFANGRINYFFKFSGPSFNIDTACSSSMAAVHAACSALWAGEADTVLAGGLNIITDPDNYAGLCNAYFLSKTGQCKVWDMDADGYCRADGVGSVVIKRLEDADADNDNILAVVLSANTNHSAEAISITHPHAGAQKDNYRQVLTKAGVNPLDVSYIELHGTGTQAGDSIESESVLDVFAPLAPRRRPDQQLHLGAVKSNIGHGEAAAGIASLIKVLLMYQKDQIPAHIGIKTEINPAIPKKLERRNAFLPMTMTAWPRLPGKKRVALVNSFGAHGGNTSLLLEDAPQKKQKIDGSSRSTGDRLTHTITLSAKSKKSLEANMENLLSYLEQHPETELADLSYTTCARRIHHSLRVATCVSTVAGLQKFLRSSLESKTTFTGIRPIPLDPGSVVFTFTGQGAFYRGIGQELFADFPPFRMQVLQLDRLVQRLGFPSVVPVIDGSAEDDEANSPVRSQLSVVVLEIALAYFWTLLGIQPSAVIGHSLGEFAAFTVAGILSAADALYLVGRRAQLIEERCTPGTHAMLSVLASPTDIERVIRDAACQVQYEVSCRNTHQDTVLGGTRDAMDTIRQTLEIYSYKCVLLDIPYAFHTVQMDDAMLDELESLARGIPFKAPSIPVLSTLLGIAVFDGKTINANYIRRQTRNAVDFAAAIQSGQQLGMVDDKTLWVEVGPHPICTGFVRKLLPQARMVSSCHRNEDNLTTVAKSLVTMHLGGFTPCWNDYFRPHEQMYSLLHLPKYSWNETDYWIPYIGTWTLDKALLKYGVGATGNNRAAGISSSSALRTSLIHQITGETVEATTATLHVISDMQHPEFLDAVHGHKMNNCGVATSSIWTDMAMSVGEYLYRLLVPQVQDVHMNVGNFEVLHAQVANKSKGSSQPLALHAHLDLVTQSMSLSWYNVSGETGERAAEAFASATVRFEDPDVWQAEWARVTHLVQGRIETLRDMATEGTASRLSKPLAYTLFKNVVDYADRYRGMDSVILHHYEAVADVRLSVERHGTWHTPPPHWIDSVCHLAGLIMNGSDASNTRDYFYVTPGCESFRLLKPLEAGAQYQSYVRMFPLPVDAGSMYAGDVYILQDGKVVGMVGQIGFRRVPRLLMDRFFSPTSSSPGTDALAPPPQVKVTEATILPFRQEKPRNTARADVNANKVFAPVVPEPLTPLVEMTVPQRGHTDYMSATKLIQGGTSSIGSTTPDTATLAESVTTTDSGLVSQCLDIIATETSLDRADLTPEATFVQLGIDSPMSLVLSEKFRSELGMEIKSSLFLEYPTIGEMKGWLEQHC